MRALLVLTLMTGCYSSAMRPGVIAKMTELPVEPERRNGVLDSSNAQPTPEQHKRLTRKERQVETVAATAAAAIGLLFSKTKNVTPSFGGTFDENTIFGTDHAPKSEPGQGKDKKTVSEPATEPGTLVPWVRLK